MDSNQSQDFVKTDFCGHRCDSCKIDFDTIEDAVEHSSSHHDKNNSPTFTCGFCSQQLNNVELLVDHHSEHHTFEHEGLDILAENSNYLNNNNEQAATFAKSSADPQHVSKLETSTSDKQPQAKRKRRVVELNNYTQEMNMLPQKKPTLAFPFAREEIEIDMSRVSCLRLKNNESSQTEHLLMERQEQIFEYLQKIDEKLDSVIKHFNVPYHNPVKIRSFTSLSQPTRKTTTPTTPSFTNGETSDQVHLVIMGEDPEQGEITRYVIAEELIETMYLRSRNRGNFAKHLAYAVFPPEERVGRNCFGRRSSVMTGRKLALNPGKLEAVREAVFQKYPCMDGEVEEQAWRKECVIAIDTALRSEHRTRTTTKDESSNGSQLK